MTKGTRQINAESLATASDLLTNLGSGSPRPQQPIREALAAAQQVFTDAGYLSGAERGTLRVGILRLRAVASAIDGNLRVSRSDYALVADTARSFRELGTSIGTRDREVRQRDATMRHSALGLRFDGVDAVRDGGPSQLVQGGRVVRASEEHTWNDLEHYREKMPRLRTGAPFVIFRCPLVVYTRNYLDDATLDRSAMRWMRGGSAGNGGFDPALKRVRVGGPYQIVLEDQLLIGLDRTRLLDDRGGAVRNVIAQLQSRMGKLVPGLGEKGRLLVSPGNPLSWLWLVPARVMATTHMVPTEVSFPWKTEHVQLSDVQRAQHRREIESINDQAQLLLREGKSIDAGILARQSMLMERLDRSLSPQEREREHRLASGLKEPPTLAERRSAMQTRIDERCLPVRESIADLKSQIAELGPSAKPPGKNARVAVDLRRKMKELEAIIAHITDEEMRRARREMQSGA